MRSFWLGVSLLTLVLFVQSESTGADKKVAQAAVTNWGQPKELAKGKEAVFWVWYEKGYWYLRTTGGKELHRFQGLVTVTGGKMSDLKGLGGEKKGKLADAFVFNTAKTALEFQFNTGPQWDGLNFAVDEAATEVKFEFKIDGTAQAAHIKIGKDGDHPTDATFATPAHPVNTSATDDKPKKGKKK